MPTNPFTSNGICVPISQECSEKLLACVQLLVCSFQNGCKASGRGMTQKRKNESQIGYQNPDRTSGNERGLWRNASAFTPLSALSYLPAMVLKQGFCLCLPNASPLQKQSSFLSPPERLPWEQGDSCVRQLWDQGAVCSWDKKNPHGGTVALIYSHDRLRIVQQVGSGTRLINSCVWRKQMGLLAASGCMGPPSWCDSYPWSPLTHAAVRCRW